MFRFFATTNFSQAITFTVAVVYIYFNWTGFVENREQNKLYQRQYTTLNAMFKTIDSCI